MRLTIPRSCRKSTLLEGRGVVIAAMLLCGACGAESTEPPANPDAGVDDLGAQDAAAADQASNDTSGGSTYRDPVERLVKPLLDGQWTVGAVVGLMSEEGTEVYGFGQRSQTDTRAPGGETLFEIGSISKTFTALLLAQAVDAKAVDLDQPVQELLPADRVSVPQRNGKQITLAQLSSHTSGLPRLPDNFAPAAPGNPYADYGDQRLYQFLSTHQLARDPGTEPPQYSNLGVGLLGHALSLKQQTSFPQLVSDQITAPLQLHDTAIALSHEQKSRLAAGHDADLNPTEAWDFGVLAPAGALRSTAKDLLRYLAAQSGLTATRLTPQMHMTHRPRASFSSEVKIGLAWLGLSETRASSGTMAAPAVSPALPGLT